MAGSHRGKTNRPFTDSILAARLEAIKQLAGGLTDRVAVMDRNFNVIYANESAWSSASVRSSDAPRAKCYEAFAHQTDPCGTCPAIKVFKAPEVRSVSCSGGGDGAACGIHQGLVALLLLLTFLHDLVLGPRVSHVSAIPESARTAWEHILVRTARWLTRLSLFIALTVILVAVVLARS